MNDLKVSKIFIKNINPNKENPRQIDPDRFNKLNNSLSEFGLIEPIIINTKSNEIIGGHQRYNILLDEYTQNGKNKELFILNLGDISWVFSETDLKIKSKDYENALNIALNNDKAMGVYDESLLYDITLNLKEKGLLGLTQFEDSDLEELEVKLKTLEDDDSKDDVDVAEDEFSLEDEIESKVKANDLWKLGNHYLLCADSTKKENIQRLINENNIDMILTDPPYGMNLNTNYTSMGNSINHNSSSKNHRKVKGDNNDFSNDLIGTIFNNFQDVSEIFLFGADYYAELIPERKNGSWLVWDKRKGVEEVYWQTSEFELIWSKEKHHRQILRHMWLGFAGRQYEDVQESIHPTQKPIKLLGDILKKFSKENNNILDLYGGSGSTLIACQQLKMNCFMMELDPYYCDVIISRWEEFTNEKAVKIN